MQTRRVDALCGCVRSNAPISKRYLWQARHGAVATPSLKDARAVAHLCRSNDSNNVLCCVVLTMEATNSSRHICRLAWATCQGALFDQQEGPTEQEETNYLATYTNQSYMPSDLFDYSLT